MATTNLLPVPKHQLLGNNGQTVPGAKIFTYAAGTTNKLATFTDSTGAVPNTNPIIADASGRFDCWLTPDTAYKIVFSPSTDSDPPANAFWTVDGIVAISAKVPWAVAGGGADAITAAYAPTNTLVDGLLLSFR